MNFMTTKHELTADQIIKRVVEGSDEAILIETCTCGCGGKVKRKGSLFCIGHDAKLKSRLQKVCDGKIPAADIPREAVERKPLISFLTSRHDLRDVIPNV